MALSPEERGKLHAEDIKACRVLQNPGATEEEVETARKTRERVAAALAADYDSSKSQST